MKSLGASNPHLIIPIGIPGSGKTYFAKHFANYFNAPLIDLEALRLKIFGKRLITSKQEELVNDIAQSFLDEALKTGQTIVYDGVSSRPHLLDVKKKARAHQYEPVFVWTQTGVSKSMRRYINLGGDKATFESLVSKFKAPLASDRTIVISGQHTFSSQLSKILKFLAGPSVNQEPASARRSIIIRR
jgi:predicted kinase